MQTATAIGAFALAAALATMTPGLDTALILRTTAVEGKRRACMAALGIAVGVLVWGSATAFGLSQLFRASALAYNVLRWAGALYLLYLGVRMLLHPRTSFAETPTGAPQLPLVQLSGFAWFIRGMLTNVLNPKVGLFYVSFLPQFVPSHVNSPRALMLLFASIHSAEAILWFGVLIIATERLAHTLRRPSVVKFLDRAMGTLFVAFGARLAVDSRQ
ncbi:MAG: LysE family translocator [Gemmatimonadaceae bacterium]